VNQKITRVTQKDIEKERLCKWSTILCVQCNAVIKEQPRELHQDEDICFVCFSKIEDWQDQCMVSEEQLVKELNV
jgi:formylmethanofuran dehydrogenase subunit E